mmetsp:Transcript_48129/g.112655  ORF Transcript_48129/g.112655 Transcript_48129/m.112655 type:complete len:139 (+) Transcript_48129:67-483(+)
MGCGPSSEANEQFVRLVFTTQPLVECMCCPGLKQVNGIIPSWLPQASYSRILEICAPYHAWIYCQMDCCGSPVCENPFEQANAPLQQLKQELPSYNFSFSAEWIGFGKNANWQHVLEIRPGMAVGQVVGIEAPAQGNM